jgi:hypothetical protein
MNLRVVGLLVLMAVVCADRPGGDKGSKQPVKKPGGNDVKNSSSMGLHVNCSTGKADGQPEHHRPHSGSDSMKRSKQQVSQEVLYQAVRSEDCRIPANRTDVDGHDKDRSSFTRSSDSTPPPRGEKRPGDGGKRPGDGGKRPGDGGKRPGDDHRHL